MKIKFTHAGEDWEIGYDGYSFTPKRLYQSESKEGVIVDREKQLGYFSTLGSATKKIIDISFGESEETIPLAAFVERYESAVKELVGLFESEF